MKIICKTNTWEPGTMYGDEGPKSVTYTGDIVGCFYDENRRDTMFVIWDAEADKFRSVPVERSKPCSPQS